MADDDHDEQNQAHLRPPSDGDDPEVRAKETQRRGKKHESAISRITAVSIHLIEDVIYALTACVLVAGALIVLGESVYQLVTQLSDGVTRAIELTLNSLLIVFILVELLAAVRLAIDEHLLIGEPFLLVGILASIKEMVLLTTFKLEGGDAGKTVLKIGVLAAVVIGLAVATLVLRRREREPKESGDA
ncbi:MAG: phosphate-starvation-inducible PsiE family protein [Actinomycetota bacterium]|nr:phosphate-starvation-inducible PsiE family protein [Actinomycetota bacterium]